MGAVFRLTGNTVMPAPGVRVLRAADYAIAFGGARKTPAAVAAVADRVIANEAELRALLDSIAENGLPK